ncbi:hypothetical protein H7E67_03865 [Clostridium gasigenes]|uniref:hypothetical protein n=1 Tax=Clostridium gasigenes TaxID=94869 RepID=UPI00162A3FEC|nr:hypothetical protein [Clostridium gasigenes]MBB6622559.1 hypothetical protein [Clostridium gasigenes]
MARKTCPVHGIVDMKHSCSRKRSYREYAKTREDKGYASSGEWIKLRADVIEEQKSMCLWSFYVEGTIKQVDQCHHIIEVRVDDSKVFDRENVIGLDRDVHRLVHKYYKTKYRTDCLRLLIDFNYRMSKGIVLEDLGIYKQRIQQWELSEM